MSTIEFINYFKSIGFEIIENERVLRGFIIFKNQKHFEFFIDLKTKFFHLLYTTTYAEQKLIYFQEFSEINEVKNLVENNRVFKNASLDVW